MGIRLKLYKKPSLIKKKGYLKNILWYLVNNLFFNSFITLTTVKICLLKIFGAKIGKNVVIKNYIKIKYPWNLEVGDNVWIGEDVWIDNISKVIIENDCCISQGVFICTGSHDFKKTTFDLISEEIVIKNSSWIGAKSIILHGSKIQNNSFVKAGSIIKKNN